MHKFVFSKELSVVITLHADRKHSICASALIGFTNCCVRGSYSDVINKEIKAMSNCKHNNLLIVRIKSVYDHNSLGVGNIPVLYAQGRMLSCESR